MNHEALLEKAWEEAAFMLKNANVALQYLAKAEKNVLVYMNYHSHDICQPLRRENVYGIDKL